MRKASRVLGIVGGSLCLATALLLGLAMLFVASFSGYEFYDESILNMSLAYKAGTYSAIDPYLNDALLDILPFLICSIAAGALGITAGVLVYKKNIASGVMFIAAAGASYFSFIPMACLILAAIFAFVKPKPKPLYPYYPYPPYPYYPPYGAPYYGPYGVPQGQYPPLHVPYYGYQYYQPPYPQQQPSPAAPHEAPRQEPVPHEAQDSGQPQS